MNIANKTVLITGANRGIGRALVEEALKRGATRVYAGTRGALQHPDKRVTPLTLDVTNEAQIRGAVDEVESLDILINNAGVSPFDDLSERRVLEQQLAVNLFGPYDVTQAFLPLLMVLPVGGISRKTPLCVPLAVRRAQTLSPSPTKSSITNLRSGKAVRVLATTCLMPSAFGGVPGGASWLM